MFNVPVETLQRYAGRYANDSGVSLAVALTNNQLVLTPPGQGSMTLVPTAEAAFGVAEVPNLSVSFAGRAGTIERMVVTSPTGSQTFGRVNTEAAAAAAAAPPAPAEKPADPAPVRLVVRTAARPWPGFRGENAAGSADGQGAVTEWDIDKGTNVRWKTPIPGIATRARSSGATRSSSSARISSAGDTTFRTGLYGDVKPVDDLSQHTWKIYCLDKASGKVLWEQVAFTGLPKVKRHTKA